MIALLLVHEVQSQAGQGIGGAITLGKIPAKQLLIRLYPGRDDALLTAIESIPPGQREAEYRRGLAWYLVPGGFRELYQALQGVKPAPPPITPPPPDAAKVLQEAMADFGWNEDE